MGKVITVWEAPQRQIHVLLYSGKSLTRDKLESHHYQCRYECPMLPVWLPEQIIQTNTSIGQVLSRWRLIPLDLIM